LQRRSRGDFFNLQRALAKHGDITAPTSGLTTDIAIAEMRELSQQVFARFKRQYILARRDIFVLVDALTLNDIVGRFTSIPAEMKDVETSLEKLKSKLKAFITYQMGSSIVSMGVPCGFYDEAGRGDQKGIAVELNQYLFGLCFLSDPPASGYRNFADYLLMNFSSVSRAERDRDFSFVIAEFTVVLERRRLADYWREHKEFIRALELNQLDRSVVTLNFTATYKADLDAVFGYLDQLLAKH
jgi:hypothetical protein